MKRLLAELGADVAFFRRNPELPLALLCAIIMALVVALTGCGVPVAIRVEDAKSGLSVEASFK